MTTKILRCMLVLAILALSAPAQAGSMERASAIKAFEEGQTLIESGDIAGACTKFQESYDLDAQLGSLLYLADCRQQNAQFATAWALFLSAAEWAEKDGDERQEVAQDRADALASKVSYLQLELPSDLPKGAVVTRDGKAIAKQLWARQIPLDSGEYEIQVSAEGFETWTGTAQVEGQGSTTSLTVPSLVALPAADAAVGATATPSDSGPSKPQRSLVARKWPAFVAAGVGVAGGVVWGVFGVQSMGAKKDADELCGEGFKCVDADGTDLRKKAYSAGNIATIGAIVTGVGIAAATVLWFTLPGGNASELASRSGTESGMNLQVGVQPMGASLRGTF